MALKDPDSKAALNFGLRLCAMIVITGIPLFIKLLQMPPQSIRPMIWGGLCFLISFAGVVLGIPLSIFDLWQNFKNSNSAIYAPLGLIACFAPYYVAQVVIYIMEVCGFPLSP